MSIRVAFFGSSDFSVPILSALNNYFLVSAVITQPDRQKGRGKEVLFSPVKNQAKADGMPVFQPANLSKTAMKPVIENRNIELIVVAAYGKILPKWILDYPTYGCINVHASLLPRWRGASPIQSVILSGERETGVTIMLMDEGLDTGKIINKKEIPVSADDTYESLGNRLSLLGAEFLIDTLNEYISGNIIPVSQDETEATYCGLIKKEDGRLDFNLTAEELERQVRAFYPWPGSFFEWNGNVLKVYDSEVSSTHSLNPFERGIVKRYPVIGSSSYDLLLKKVQVPGKKVVTGAEFLNGMRGWLDNEN